MKKEEILEMSRKSNSDEGMEYAENQGRKIGFFVFAILFVIIALFSLFTQQTGTLNAASSLFWAFMAAESYPKYRFTRKKAYLVSTIAGCVASLSFIASFIIHTLG
jgi:hypothetical protein